MNNYDDIINLPHHVSTKHPRMTMKNRAAQFSPFAALSGYDAAISETSRLTSERIELAEGAIAALDMKLSILTDMVDERPEVTITYFQPDKLKEGGTYVTITGAVKKIDGVKHAIALTNNILIPIADVLNIESELFRNLE